MTAPKCVHQVTVDLATTGTLFYQLLSFYFLGVLDEKPIYLRVEKTSSKDYLRLILDLKLFEAIVK